MCIFTAAVEQKKALRNKLNPSVMNFDFLFDLDMPEGHRQILEQLLNEHGKLTVENSKLTDRRDVLAYELSLAMGVLDMVVETPRMPKEVKHNAQEVIDRIER
jgi:hypothetical protein